MAIRKGTSRGTFRGLDGTSSRDLVFYSNTLISQGLIVDGTTTSHDACKQQVLSHLNKYDGEERERQTNWLNSQRNSNLLPEEYFEWVENDERACCWAWGKLMLEPITPQLPNISGLDTRLKKTDFHASLRAFPSSTKERLDSIIYFFDTLGFLLDYKKNTIEKMKEEWQSIYSSPHPFKYIDANNHEQCEWAWNYLQEREMAIPIFKPLNPREKYLAAVASMDLANIHIDTKKIFLMGMKKAWNQKTYRQKQQGKKPLNTYINEDTKEKLTWLANQRGQNINKTLEWLINKEYKNHT